MLASAPSYVGSPAKIRIGSLVICVSSDIGLRMSPWSTFRLDRNGGSSFSFCPGAPHGFHADYRASYRKDAAEDGWNQMIAWFKKYKVLA